MTEDSRRLKREKHTPQPISMPLLAELRKARNTASITISGIISITELSKTAVSLATHTGRVILKGEALSLIIFEGGVVTVNGKIAEVSFGYAKN